MNKYGRRKETNKHYTLMIVPTITTIPLNKFDMNFDLINKTSIEFKVLTAKSICRLKDALTFKLEQLHNSIYVDNTVIDNLDFKYRLSVIYILLQQKHKILKILNLGLKAKFNSITQTISNVFYGIGAVEREIYDLFGVFFKDHPDLRRVLSDYGFRGNPLKKDFPLTGTTEVFFSIIKKILIFKALKLSQEMRVFEYESPWIMNNDFSNYPKTEEEDDIEMELVSNIIKMFTVLFFFYLFSPFQGLDFNRKSTCPPPKKLNILEEQKIFIVNQCQKKNTKPPAPVWDNYLSLKKANTQHQWHEWVLDQIKGLKEMNKEKSILIKTLKNNPDKNQDKKKINILEEQNAIKANKINFLEHKNAIKSNRIESLERQENINLNLIQQAKEQGKENDMLKHNQILIKAAYNKFKFSSTVQKNNYFLHFLNSLCGRTDPDSEQIKIHFDFYSSQMKKATRPIEKTYILNKFMESLSQTFDSYSYAEFLRSNRSMDDRPFIELIYDYALNNTLNSLNTQLIMRPFSQKEVQVGEFFFNPEQVDLDSIILFLQQLQESLPPTISIFFKVLIIFIQQRKMIRLWLSPLEYKIKGLYSTIKNRTKKNNKNTNVDTKEKNLLT